MGADVRTTSGSKNCTTCNYFNSYKSRINYKGEKEFECTRQNRYTWPRGVCAYHSDNEK